MTVTRLSEYRRTWTRMTLDVCALLVLTSVHHVYGAVHYETPWRFHVLLGSIPAMLVLLASWHLGADGGETWKGRAAFWISALTAGAVLLAIGGFEGLYNHGLKDALYFMGTSVSTLRALFPPPKYEMPNDVFFEVTGVLQVVPAVFGAVHLGRLLARRRRALSPSGGLTLTQREGLGSAFRR